MTSLLSQLRRNKADLLELALMGNPCLRRISTPFTKEEILSEETRTLKRQMFATMMQEEGMGLAAPQVQINKRLVVIRYDSGTEDIPNIPTTYLFNPVLTPRDDNGGPPNMRSLPMMEGCLSVPGLVARVWRYPRVTLSYLDEQGEPKKMWAKGFVAGLLQHEIDHLDGKLYVDHVKEGDLYFLDQWHHFKDKISESGSYGWL